METLARTATLAVAVIALRYCIGAVGMVIDLSGLMEVIELIEL